MISFVCGIEHRVSQRGTEIELWFPEAGLGEKGRGWSKAIDFQLQNEQVAETYLCSRGSVKITDIIHLKPAERKDNKCLCNTHTNRNRELMDTLSGVIVIIISQCLCMSKYYTVHFKYLQFSCVNHASVNLVAKTNLRKEFIYINKEVFSHWLDSQQGWPDDKWQRIGVDVGGLTARPWPCQEPRRNISISASSILKEFLYLF